MTEMRVPYNPIDVANYIVRRANEKQNPVTHLKLQKLLYYVVAMYFQKYDRRLIDEDVVKWQYGPVVKSVYHQFKILGSLKITELSEYIESIDSPFSVKWADVHDRVQRLERDNDFKIVADKVIDDLLESNAFKLVDITHAEPAWYNYKDEILRGSEPTYSDAELKAAKYD
ncbi:Panacea domain-containing protein [Neisseria animaloris]|uniref:Panacea domain-containing protein n=1 Tax=Neisseria animaloris TaxID=326522 RepID=UPI0039E1BFB0